MDFPKLKVSGTYPNESGELRTLVSTRDDRRDILIAEVYEYNPYNTKPFNTQKEMGTLIAAAPELLDALEDIVKYCEDNDVPCDLENAKYAIEHARNGRQIS